MLPWYLQCVYGFHTMQHSLLFSSVMHVHLNNQQAICSSAQDEEDSEEDEEEDEEDESDEEDEEEEGSEEEEETLPPVKKPQVK